MDDDGSQSLLSGFHLVNRVGFLISTPTVPARVTIRVRLDSQRHGALATANRRRVLKAERVIVDYAPGSRLENLTDLLADLRHWCDEHDEDFRNLDDLAERHYVAECINEED